MTSNRYSPPQEKRRSLRHVLGEFIYKNGPQTEIALRVNADLGGKSSDRTSAVQNSIRSGWLTIQADGRIGCSATAREHYDSLHGIKAHKPLGQLATLRERGNVYERPPLSKRHIPNSRGLRDDVPAWSVRTNTSFHTKA
jgi:hypothetical protein